MYSQIKISAPNTLPHGGAARAWLTKIDPEQKIPRAIFHKTQDGKNLDGVSPFRFSAPGGDCQITAVGRQATAILTGSLATIQEVVNQANGQPCAISLNIDQCRIAEVEAGQTCLHECKHLVLQQPARKNGKNWRAPKWEPELLDTEEYKARAKAVILKGINDQLDLMNHPGPDCEIEVSIMKLEPSSPIPVAGEKNLGQFAVNVKFLANVELFGPWNLGRLTSKGAGHIRRIRLLDKAAA